MTTEPDEPSADALGNDRQQMFAPSRPIKRSFSIAGHRTSISLEAAFWDALKTIAASKDCSLASLVAEIDRERGDAGLSGAIRVWILDYYQRRTDSQSATDQESTI
ncbi:MAG: ribbon-helix-helix domain-containing protein [Pseudomonadota bacterium]